MTNKDKTIVIAGMAFNVTFFVLMMISVFITNAIAIGMLVSFMTYLFFSKCYYAQKKTETHGNE